MRVILRLAALLSLRGLQLRIATRYDTLGNRLRRGTWTQAILAELQMSFDSRHFLALEFLIFFLSQYSSTLDYPCQLNEWLTIASATNALYLGHR